MVLGDVSADPVLSQWENPLLGYPLNGSTSNPLNPHTKYRRSTDHFFKVIQGSTGHTGVNRSSKGSIGHPRGMKGYERGMKGVNRSSKEYERGQ